MQVSGTKPMEYTQDDYRKALGYKTEREQFKDLPDTPLSDFQRALISWETGETKEALSEAEIGKLKSKYNTMNMSEKDNIALLGELVEMGVLTKMEASYIYNGVVPISSDLTEESLKKCDTEYNSSRMRAGNSPSTTDWLEHYQEVLMQVLSNTTANIGESSVIKSYQEYVDILSRLAADKATAVV